jgi:hypothetical protein
MALGKGRAKCQLTQSDTASHIKADGVQVTDCSSHSSILGSRDPRVGSVKRKTEEDPLPTRIAKQSYNEPLLELQKLMPGRAQWYTSVIPITRGGVRRIEIQGHS